MHTNNITNRPNCLIANTMYYLQLLGKKTAYLGKVGNDDLGHDYINHLKDNHIAYALHPDDDNSITGRSLSFITPDREKTVCANFGAAYSLKCSDIIDNHNIITKSRITIIPTYLLNNPEGKKYSRIYSQPMNQGTKIALILSNKDTVETHKDYLSRYHFNEYPYYTFN